jgi:flagellar biosynthetic protein FliQ
VPKIVAILLTLLFTLPWIMNKMTAFTGQLIVNIPLYAK